MWIESRRSSAARRGVGQKYPTKGDFREVLEAVTTSYAPCVAGHWAGNAWNSSKGRTVKNCSDRRSGTHISGLKQLTGAFK